MSDRTYTVVARTDEAPGAKGLSAFVVDADLPGLKIAERIEVQKLIIAREVFRG